jgi:hypothetical protein
MMNVQLRWKRAIEACEASPKFKLLSFLDFLGKYPRFHSPNRPGQMAGILWLCVQRLPAATKPADECNYDYVSLRCPAD